jgi:ribosome-associated protein
MKGRKMDQSFTITGEYIALNKLLKASGVCATGGQAKIVIEGGLVEVDGKTETRKRRKVKDGMIITHGSHNVKVICTRK